MESKEIELRTLRHSSEHVLAEAILKLYPNTKMAMGPATDEGFYGDFEFDENTTISLDDLPKIEKEMRKIIESKAKITRKEVSIAEARKLFEGNEYKQDWINEIEKRGEKVTVYYTGDSFVDLCAGPHVDNTGEIKAFKLTSVAGAYWHGDSNNKMLTRIYGTSFFTKEELDEHFKMLEEAKKRDHRKIGKEMDLFHFNPEYAPGAIFWHDKGFKLYRSLIEYMRKRQDENGYIEISTPAVMDRVLWETSGHWEKYGEHNYSGSTQDGRVFCIKPMNCPGGILIYKQGLKSYKDLPLKMAEFGKVHRYEASGTLSGLMRAREFTQDDAHIFCTPEQLEDECITTLKLILDIYKDFGFDEVKIVLATRPEKRIGSDEIWDITENALSNALKNHGYEFEVHEGDGAFYGPKLEFHLKDSLKRSWQCGTVQVDMNLPERFDITYVDKDNEKRRPVMIHRALFGSIERFLGILIENVEGKFPLWLAPLKVNVLTVSENFNEYGKKVLDALNKEGLFSEGDFSNEKIGYKIRAHIQDRVPYTLILGAKEAGSNTVTLKKRGEEKQEVLTLDEFINKLKLEIQKKK
ncbi:MAG: threonine--tRNA ligase [Bdellovibrionota bacterium]|nr:threonine--tRNA ligase [Pseudomonadota bacterium]MDY6091115.1 threonine--tRNA ligase [Bdellovibrionota bacterium]